MFCRAPSSEHCDAWKSAFRDECKDHRFYEIVAQTLADDFEYHYLVLEDSTRESARHSTALFLRQNVCEGVSGKLRRVVDKVQQRFPRFLTMRVLMVGCAAGESHLGVCLPEDEEWAAARLHECLKTYARSNRASLVVLKDFSAQYRETLARFFLQWLCPHSEHADDAIAAPLFRFRRIFEVVRQGDAQKSAAENFEKPKTPRRSVSK